MKLIKEFSIGSLLHEVRLLVTGPLTESLIDSLVKG